MGTNIEHQYLKLLHDIISSGKEKEDRTGTGTISVFGRQIRHKMSEGFPLLTTKKMAWKTMVTELLWFLRGDTNIKFLVDNGCHIWDGDVYKAYERWYGNMSKTTPFEVPRKLTQDELIKAISLDEWHAKHFGDLGPIYGKQWRKWAYEAGEINKGGIDQIANLINDLKTNPDSRRLMVNAWNVGELDSMVLPPCHYGFQVYTTVMSERERKALWANSHGHNESYAVDFDHSDLDARGFPTRKISLMWNQRSVDTFLGLPFNIASYALLLSIIAKEVNMIPDELIGNLGDVHLYKNHISQAKEQLTRQPMVLPKLTYLDEYHYLTDKEISGEIPFSEKVTQFRPDFFSVENYESHPSIKAPLSN